MTASDIAATVRELADIAAIKALKQRYADAADAKYALDGSTAAQEGATRQVACFTEDAAWEGGPFGGTIRGTEALLAFFLRSPWRFTSHSYQPAQIEVDGDYARAHWRLWELGVRSEDGRVVLLVGRTEETYARLPDLGWRIASMRFKNLHAIEVGAGPGSLHRLIPA
jgi:hypothetical protein